MIRSWGIVTLTGSAQPLFGDTLTAAFTPSQRLNQPQTVQVASTTRYRVGDRIILGVGQAGANCVMVDQIVDSTHLSVRSEGGAALNSWTNGTIIALEISCAVIRLQGMSTNAGSTYIGSDNTVTNTGGGSAFEYLAAGGSDQIGIPQFNCLLTTEGWMAGILNDKLGVAAIVI